MKHFYLVPAVLLAAFAARAQTPTITSFEPARNSWVAPRTAAIRLGFSQPIEVSPVYAFSSQRGGRLAGAASASGSVLTFVPGGGFQPGETVQVTVPASVRSTAGKPLAIGQVYQYTTGVAASTGVFEPGSSVALGTISATSIMPSSITAADVDGDGDQDLVVANGNYNPGTVSVRLNNGAGFYAGGSEVAVGNFPFEVKMADVNGDGSLDLLAYCSSEGINVRLNNGKGQFGGGSTVRASGSITLADVDADGDLDMLLVAGDNKVLVFYNDGTGGFGPSLVLAGGQYALAVGDLDGDGALDIVTNDPTSSGGQQLVRRGKGDGTFSTTTTTTPMSVSNAPATRLLLADLDADGDLDLLASCYNGIYSMRNDGQANFSPKVLLAGSAGYSVAQLADLEGDGDPDLLLLSTSATGTSVVRRLNDGKGNFSANDNLVTTESLYDIATADVDGDGDLDLLTVGSDSRRARVWLNQNTLPGPLSLVALSPMRHAMSAARTSPVTLTFSKPLAAPPAAPDAVQLAGAQRGRLAAASLVSGSTWQLQPAAAFLPGEKVTVTATRSVRGSNARLTTPQVYQFTAAAGVGPATFEPRLTLPSGGYTGKVVIPADIDGDGRPDLCSLGASQYGQISIALNLGNGNFGPTRYLGTDTYPTGLSIADMDGDGDLDLVASSGYGYTNSPGRVRVYTNIGAGNFSAGPAIAAGNLTLGVTTGDLDGDGDQDILVLSESAGKAQVLLNESDGTFTPLAKFTAGASADLALGDVDNDGDLDLLTSDSRSLSISLNDGNASFAPPATTLFASSGVLALADVDLDGDLDVLAASGSYVSVLSNNGQGVFTLSSTVNVVGGGVNSIAAGDIDGDGDLDFVSGGGALDGTVSVRMNDGSGHFSGSYNPVVAPSLTMPTGVALADLDGDGDLDLPVLRYNLSGISVCFNQVAILAAASPAALATGLSVVPNPARHTTTLRGARPGDPVQLLDATGRVVLSTIAPAAGKCDLALPPGLATGLYVVRVREQAVRLLVE